MKDAVSSVEKSDAYRATQIARILQAADRYGVDIAGRDIVDLGCNDGAITVQYPQHGARTVVGVDIDADAVAAARRKHRHPAVEYHVATTTAIPLSDASADVILCYDVFEHVSHPSAILAECRRILRPAGMLLIGTWGWHHPFAPHLWATMPVPWAHVLFSERTVLRASRRVYQSSWYVPTMHDLDERGVKKADKYLDEELSTEYLNKLLIKDFERVFEQSGMAWAAHLEPFGSPYARWTRIFLGVPYLREFFAAYLWAVLRKTNA